MSPQLQLDPAAKQALGSLDPKGAWFLLVDRATTALELDPEKCQQLAEKDNILNQPDDPQEIQDLEDVREVLVGMDPVLGINLFHDQNPSFNLQAIQQSKPLDVFQRLIAIFKSDRWLSTVGD